MKFGFTKRRSSSRQDAPSRPDSASRRVPTSAWTSFRRWLRGLAERVGVIVLAVVCGVLVFDRILMPRVVGHGDETPVPPVAGKELVQAEAVLRQAGLQPVRVAGRFNPEVPRGSVLEVHPSVGLSVKRGRQIFITPSLGMVSRHVPDLAEASLRVAKMQLSNLGLRVAAIEYAATDAVPPDQILAMTPDPGAPLPENGEVSLLVSCARAPAPLWMPDLIGRAGSTARSLLEDSGLSVSVTSGSGRGAPGTVVHQEPAAGTPVWPGGQVRLGLAPGTEVRASSQRGRRW